MVGTSEASRSLKYGLLVDWTLDAKGPRPMRWPAQPSSMEAACKACCSASASSWCVTWASGIKLVVMPLIGWAVAHFVFGVSGVPLLGVVAMAALPTAQNVFLFSSKFKMPTELVQNVILVSSLLCLPVILVAALLLG